MKNWIFIEAKDTRTPEAQFLTAVLLKYFPGKEYEFIPMNGESNLKRDAIITQIQQHASDGDNCLCIMDADTEAKGWGYDRRKADLETFRHKNHLDFEYFLYPDNSSDGDVEVLMESLARRDLHSIIFDCFEDYEACVSGKKDEKGDPVYNTPNRKGKLHTYITAIKLNKTNRDKLGSGQWLFDNPDLWDLTRPDLKALLDFFDKNLK